MTSPTPTLPRVEPAGEAAMPDDPLKAIERNGLKGFGFSVLIDNTNTNQAPHPSPEALAAGPAGLSSPSAGPANQSEQSEG